MQDDYIESRLDPQIKYYDKRSTRCHNEHNYLSIFGIILTAAIPPLTLLSETAPIMKFFIATAGAVSSILSSILYLHNAKENWIESRAICESLKAEKEKYLHYASVYRQDISPQVRASLFIEHCEAMMQEERANWTLRMRDSNPQVYMNNFNYPQVDSDSSTSSSTSS